MKGLVQPRPVIVALSAGLILLAAGRASASSAFGLAKGLCGDGVIEKGEQCDQNNLNGKTCQSLGFEGGTLSCGANCQFDTSQCVTYQSAFQSCETSLGTCEAATCGNGIAEFGEQCDGENLQGHTCQTQGFTYGTLTCSSSCTFDTSKCTNSRFVDNGDQTVTDNQTGLQWEKKFDDGVTNASSSFDAQGVGNCLHCVNDTYTWATGMSEWISAVNGRTDSSSSQAGFAGHTDWRLPTNVELQTILDTNAPGCGQSPFPPCIDPTFGPTESSDYWSASTRASDPDNAWLVPFNNGFLGYDSKAISVSVRAVRTGP